MKAREWASVIYDKSKIKYKEENNINELDFYELSEMTVPDNLNIEIETEAEAREYLYQFSITSDVTQNSPIAGSIDIMP